MTVERAIQAAVVRADMALVSAGRGLCALACAAALALAVGQIRRRFSK